MAAFQVTPEALKKEAGEFGKRRIDCVWLVYPRCVRVRCKRGVSWCVYVLQMWRIFVCSA
jgi:hypothetical protein